MTRETRATVAKERPFPFLSFMVKVTVGFLPAVPLSTLAMATTRPGTCADSIGTVCAPMMEASNSNSPLGMWQLAHCLSSIWGKFTWFLPLVKFTSSWQDPQAARLGFVNQAFACVAPVVC